MNRIKIIITIFDKELFRIFFFVHLENTSGDMRMPSGLHLIYMISRNSMPTIKYYGAKFQVERKPVYHKTTNFKHGMPYAAVVTIND